MKKYRQIKKRVWESSSGDWKLKTIYQLQYSYFGIFWQDIGPWLDSEEEGDDYYQSEIEKIDEWVKYYD